MNCFVMKKFGRSAILLAVVTMVGGCGAAGWMASWLPAKKVPAKYDIPEDKTIAVLVDDPGHLVKFSPVKYELAKQLNKQFLGHKIARQVIPVEDVIKLVASNRNSKLLSNAEIGKKLGADIVVNVEIIRFALKDADYSQIWQGKLQAKVRVVDVQKGRLWPNDSVGGYKTKVIETPKMEGNPSPQFEVKMAKVLAVGMAEYVAKFFYKHPGRPHDALPDKVMDETP